MQRLQELYTELDELKKSIRVVQSAALLGLDADEFQELATEKAQLIKRKRQVEHEIACLEEEEATN